MIRFYRIFIAVVTLLLLATALAAQENTPDPAPQVEVVRAEPRRVTAGQSVTLSVFGSGFTEQTTVRVVGFGLLETTYINPTSLLAALPGSILTGRYDIEVRDPQGGTAIISQALRVVQPPPPPTEPLPPTPTLEPPTPLPGQPSLVVGSFSSNQLSVAPGGTVTLTFNVVNQGNRTAEGVSATLDSGSSFVPAAGQGGVTLPNIPPGGTYPAAITVTAVNDAPGGAAPVPITFTYRDFSGEIYTSSAELSVTVEAVQRVSQVTLDNYDFNPNPALPGQPVLIRATITNTGNETAAQVMVRVSGAENLLLAGPSGDSFPVGDIAPGQTLALEMPMIVSRAAEAGPQAQPISISYSHNGEVKEASDSFTLDIAAVEVPEALLLLSSYDTGTDILNPGDRFTLAMTLQNVGTAPATNLLVTFGTVESSSSGDSNTGGGTGSTQTTTSPSTTFAPLGTGGRLFVGTLDAGSISAEIVQDFIVSGGVNSGIYNLPITLNYQKADGAAVKETLNAGVVVIAPPRLQINLDSPVPESANVGEPLSLSLTVQNTGSARVNFTRVQVEAENGEVLEGADAALTPLPADDDLSVSGVVMPLEEGRTAITITLHYTDDLNREQTITRTYETEAIAPPPPPEVIEEPGPVIVEEPIEEDDFVERLLLGLLGLGS